MKLELNEQTLNAYLSEAINEELEEIFGLSRAERNAKWGYEWDPNISNRQNRLNRNMNKAQIKAAGYRNFDEYQAGELGDEGDEGAQGQQQQQYPELQAGQRPEFANDRNSVGKFQTWYNHNFNGNLVVDGIWGPKTQAAFDQWVAQQGNTAQQNESKKPNKVLSENQFKDLVKNTLTEFLKK